jgi:hypothetical protein
MFCRFGPRIVGQLVKTCPASIHSCTGLGGIHRNGQVRWNQDSEVVLGSKPAAGQSQPDNASPTQPARQRPPDPRSRWRMGNGEIESLGVGLRQACRTRGLCVSESLIASCVPGAASSGPTRHLSGPCSYPRFCCLYLSISYRHPAGLTVGRVESHSIGHFAGRAAWSASSMC